MKIGITERGDAGINMGWVSKLKTGNYDGAVLITKNITPLFMENVMDCHTNGSKLIVHATCTGWGGSMFEPNVPSYSEQLNSLLLLHKAGFPLSNCVLRIDPIIPSQKGLQLVQNVIAYAKGKGILPKARIRISVYDEYRHVKLRLNKAGFKSFYPGSQFSASTDQFKQVADILSKYPYKFYTCAEPELAKYGKYGQIIECGCISEQDLKILELNIPDKISVNMQNRNGCLCLSCKTELLTEKVQCPHKCIYCYWKN